MDFEFVLWTQFLLFYGVHHHGGFRKVDGNFCEQINNKITAPPSHAPFGGHGGGVMPTNLFYNISLATGDLVFVCVFLLVMSD